MFNTNLVQKGQLENNNNNNSILNIVKKKFNQNQFKTHSNLLLAYLEIIVEILKYSD
jgi:hypothetical protein